MLAAPIAYLSAYAAEPINDGQVRIIERVMETDTTMVTLPTHIGGVVTARECDVCASVTLTVTEQSRFFTKGEAVTLEQARKIVAGAPVPMRITYLRDRSLARFIAY
jgi:hypothetical protein